MTKHGAHDGQGELALCFGAVDAPPILFVQPFFEEGNRTRHVITKVMRAVSDAGFRTILPDLPGSGESVVPLHSVALNDWRGALHAAAARYGNPAMVASFRSGAIIDDAAGAGHIWRCSPESGARLVRDLMRTRLTASSAEETEATITLAGNTLNRALLDALANAEALVHGGVRVARLATEGTPADVRLEGGPIWRRSEPGDDPALRASITADIINWAKSCATR
jgi:pimeloyl-ACP methyl ester carboxylesterase